MRTPLPKRSADLRIGVLVKTCGNESSSTSFSAASEFPLFRRRGRERGGRNGGTPVSGQAIGTLVYSLAFLALATLSAFAQGTLSTLVTNGPTTKRINLVFLAEGYTAGQSAQFTANARAVLQKLTTTPPFNEYSNYFNAFAIFVASTDAGSDHPASGIFRDTYFNSTFDSYGIQRLVTIPPNDQDGDYANGKGKVDALLQTLLPDYDVALLVVNDPEYGGSGGSVVITSTEATSPEIGVHEFGHTFANLGDEYDSAYPGYPDIEEPNTTQQTNRAQIKWNVWILPSTLVPTPDVPAYYSVDGLFEGAHYHTTGWFRPKHNCKMRALGIPFCEICGEAFVLSIYGRIEPIESVSPATNAPISLTNSDAVTLSLALPHPSTHSLAVQWYVNGILQPNATNLAFTVNGWNLPQQTNSIRADVRDATALVRTDPLPLLQASRTWSVQSVVVRPTLSISPVGGQISVSWPALAAGFQLESTTSLGPPTTWTGLGVISNQTSASFLPSAAPRYFRLRHP